MKKIIIASLLFSILTSFSFSHYYDSYDSIETKGISWHDVTRYVQSKSYTYRNLVTKIFVGLKYEHVRNTCDYQSVAYVQIYFDAEYLDEKFDINKQTISMYDYSDIYRQLKSDISRLAAKRCGGVGPELYSEKQWVKISGKTYLKVTSVYDLF